MNKVKNTKSKSEPFEFDSEFDFTVMFRTLYRNKKFIFSFSTLITIFSIFYSYTITPVWKGEFDIVINSDSEGAASKNILKSLPGIPSSFTEDGTLNTQKVILQSRSVLMPVFQYVEDYYSKKNIKKNNLDFNNWLKKELNIEFIEGSNVLKVSYRNTDKELILNALKKVSSTYKNYSKLQSDKTVDKTLVYLRELKKDLKKTSLISTTEYNKFTIENGLGTIDGFVELGSGPILNSKIPDIFKNDMSEIVLSSQDVVPSSGQRYQQQFMLLSQYETQYVDLQSKLKPNSIFLINLKEKIDNLKQSLKRPNEILLKYRELYLKSKRDNSILNNVVNNIQSLEIKKYEQTDPWEIISEPIIGRSQVYPEKRKIVTQAFALSFFLASIFTLFKEKKSGRFYEISSIKEMLDINFIDIFYTSKAYLTLELIKSISKKNLKADESIGLLNLTSLSFDELISTLDPNNSMGTYELDLNMDSPNLNNGSLVLIAEPGEISDKQILLINKLNNLDEFKFLGWLLLDKKTNLT